MTVRSIHAPRAELEFTITTRGTDCHIQYSSSTAICTKEGITLPAGEYKVFDSCLAGQRLTEEQRAERLRNDFDVVIPAGAVSGMTMKVISK
jgi:hypothetical protein